jgi:hypothetical protein
LTPSADTPFGDFSGSLSVHNNITGVVVGFTFYIVSNVNTELWVYVEDEVIFFHSSIQSKYNLFAYIVYIL